MVFDSGKTDSKLGILAYLVVVPRAVEIPGCFLRFVPEVVVVPGDDADPFDFVFFRVSRAGDRARGVADENRMFIRVQFVSNEGQPNRLSALVGIWKISQRQRKLPFPPLVRLDRTFQPPVKVCRAHRGASHSREQHEFLRQRRCYSLRRGGGLRCVAPPGQHVCRLHLLCFSLRRALPICDARCGDDDNSSNTTTRRIYNRREMRKVSRGVGIARMRAQKNEEKFARKKYRWKVPN